MWTGGNLKNKTVMSLGQKRLLGLPGSFHSSRVCRGAQQMSWERTSTGKVPVRRAPCMAKRDLGPFGCKGTVGS